MDPKQDFPFFKNNPGVVYLDSASTTQIPRTVIESISDYYSHSKSNVDGMYASSRNTTNSINQVRAQVASWTGVTTNQVIFGPSVTVLSHIISQGLRHQLTPRDTIVITQQDHHSATLPYIRLAGQTGAKLVVIPVDSEGLLDLNWIRDNVSPSWKILSLSSVSNVIGVANPVAEIATILKKTAKECKIILDASQSASYDTVSEYLSYADCWYASSHKLYGPFGVAVLIGTNDFLEQLEPVIVGGKMVDVVTDTGFDISALPGALEPGTPNTADILGFGQALEYIKTHPLDAEPLTHYLAEELAKISGIICIAPAHSKHSLLSFYHTEYSAQDIGMLLSKQQICVRVGSHCAQPLHTALGSIQTVRVSLGSYTTKEDIQLCITALKKSLQLLQ